MLFSGVFPFKSGQLPNEFSCMCVCVQAGRMQRAEQGADAALDGFTQFTSAVLSLGGVSVVPLIIVTQPTLSLCALAYSAVLW